MTIPKETLEIWKEIKEEGDIEELAKLIDKSEGTIYQIFRTGEAKVEDAEKMAEFYRNRLDRIQAIKDSTKNETSDDN